MVVLPAIDNESDTTYYSDSDSKASLVIESNIGEETVNSHCEHDHLDSSHAKIMKQQSSRSCMEDLSSLLSPQKKQKWTEEEVCCNKRNLCY